MRKLPIFVAFLLTAAGAWACGDKLMLVMRVRLAQLKLGHPVSVFAYAQRDLPTSPLIRQIQLQPAVKKAGHNFLLVEDTTKLDEALEADKYDLILADLSVADELSQRVRLHPSRPVVLPVSSKSSKTEESAARRKFHSLLKAPGDSEQYFEAVDQALQSKAKALAR